MKNKTITPFCVDVKAENLSEEQIRQLHQWCLEAGADDYDGINMILEHILTDNYIGVDEDNDLHSKFNSVNYFKKNVILFKDVRTHLGLEEDTPKSQDTKQPEDTHIPQDETLETLNEIISLDRNTLVEYTNILQTDITVCQDGTYQVFMETLGERDSVLKTDAELKEFVETYQKLMKFVK